MISGLKRTIERARLVVLTEVIPEHLDRCGTSTDELFPGCCTASVTAEFGVSTRRSGKHQALVLEAPGRSRDMVWLPVARDAGELEASTADLARA